MEVIINVDDTSARAFVIKNNPKKAKVRLLEQCRSHVSGTILDVPYSMLIMPDGKPYDPRGVVAAKAWVRNSRGMAMPVNAATKKPEPAEDFYKNSFFPFVDRCAVMAMDHIYSSMSPENISWDGERPIADVNRARAVFHRRIQCLQEACEYHYSEEFCSKAVEFWEQEKRAKV